jgi:ABC-type molybdate transport system substrate-binding protein
MSFPTGAIATAFGILVFFGIGAAAEAQTSTTLTIFAAGTLAGPFLHSNTSKYLV